MSASRNEFKKRNKQYTGAGVDWQLFQCRRFIFFCSSYITKYFTYTTCCWEYQYKNKLEKEFRTPWPGFSLFGCFRKKIGLIFCKHNCLHYWFSSWARILNVQNIIIEKTKETNIPSTCRPILSTTIACADKLVYTSI